MKATVTVDSSGFTAMCRELAAIGGKSITVDAAIRLEVGRVLDNCVKYTGAPTAKAYPRRASRRVKGEGDMSLSITKQGTVWLQDRNKEGKRTFYIMGGGQPRHWSNQRWNQANRLLDNLKQKIDETDAGGSKIKKILGRGLAKASWVQIGEALGIAVKAPAYVMRAIPQDRVPRVSGKGRVFKGINNIVYELENGYPLLTGGARKGSAKNDGFGILQRAIKARVTAFTSALRHGVFRDMKARAARYPGIFVKE